ncbi:MAG: hypothetical protein ACI8Z7_000446 [Candidatus Nanohaloarchaea archaeon]|jgi:hypothetical protein
MRRAESVTAEDLVSELNEMEGEVSLEELEYDRRSLTYGRLFNLEFEPEDQPEEAENPSFYAAAIGTEDEIGEEMDLIEENVDVVLDDYVTADLGRYTGGADNRREHIKLYKLDFEDEEKIPESDDRFVYDLQFVHSLQVADSPWEDYF